MLQASEYRTDDYLKWWWRANDFSQVEKRRSLKRTHKAKILLIISWFLYITSLSLVFLTLYGSYLHRSWIEFWLSLAWFFLFPIICAHILVFPLWLGQFFFQKPRERKIIQQANDILAKHPAVKIAIAGSYGKTTAKEVLLSVLSEGKAVAATPGNENTLLGVSKFTQSLTSNEEVLIFELGESHVGDIKQLANLTQPDIGIITGINEAHLETFKTIERTVATIFELEDYLGNKPLYINLESELVLSKVTSNNLLGFTKKGIGDWKVEDARTSLGGTEFTLKTVTEKAVINVGLLGLHNIGILLAAAYIAYGLGLSMKQIQEGMKKLKPVDHRLQPRHLHGAWIIDDTYNGNIEGVEVGVSFLKAIKAKKKIYVTPGLVEQGSKKAEIHEKIGELVATVADEVILMRNSTTMHIQTGLKKADFKGEVKIIDDPLFFYSNVDQSIAAGDVMLMQNDWTDNYA